MKRPVDWAPPGDSDGVAERSFVVQSATGAVPGVLWLPRDRGHRAPLVLLGHGGSSHKRGDRMVSMAHWFVRHAGIACLAIDGPYHGARGVQPPQDHGYQERIAAVGAGRVLDQMVSDWLAALDAVSDHGPLDTGNVGYFGLSMGTRYGLPTAACLAGRLRCAVFGKFGLEQTSRLDPALDTTPRIAADAPKVIAPTLFHMQWNDDCFTRDGQLALFDRLGSPDKQLMAFPGRHDQSHPDAVEIWRTFIAVRLGRFAPGDVAVR